MSEKKILAEVAANQAATQPVSQAAPAQDGFFENHSSRSSFTRKEDVETSTSLESDGLEKQGNILTQYTDQQVESMGRNYALKYGMDVDLFARGARLARNPLEFNSMLFLSEEEKMALHTEATKKWHIPWKLVLVIALASMSAAVQGMDESVINGANIIFYPYMKIDQDTNRDKMIQGLVNGAPYLCSATLSCWMSDYVNRKLGRKWTVFWTCFISAITCFWQAFTNTWYHLFISRFFLGFGLGIKSATVPAYASECAPKHIRGALVMLWQFFTAVGIMFGYVSSLAFYYVGSHGIRGGLNWRLMLGSAMIPALIVLVQVPFVPESPRWLMGKERHKEAFDALTELRLDKISAARDTFYQYVLLSEEESYQGVPYLKRLRELFTVRRNRNGALASFVVMYMQQFCGINVIAYYSSSIFIEARMGVIKSLVASWGFGMINFVFAIPAFYTIDTYGRRNLLLTTFPLMCIFLLMAGFGFWIPDDDSHIHGRVGCIITGIYLFTAVYSSGEGPVPFTYSAEAFPLYIRDIGMGFATAVCWLFNFILALTWPLLLKAFKPQGAFGWYAAWNIVGFFLVLWFVPETKGKTLEELDEVFSVSTFEHAKWQTTHLLHKFQKNVLGKKDITPLPLLYKSHRMAVTNPHWNDKAETEHVE